MTQQEVIKAFMKSLDETNLAGEAALDEAIRKCSPFKSFEELKAALIRDCKKAGSGNTFLKNYCGINYATEDTGAITGSDAGGSTSKNAADTIPESGSLKNFTGNSFKVNDLTVKLIGKTYSQLSASEKFIWRGLYTWWIRGALDLIEESYGDNFSYGINSSATVDELYVNFYNEATRNYAKTSSDFDSAGNAYRTTLNINMYYWDTLKNNLTRANSMFDRDIAHELTHAVMHANINYYAIGLLPAFVREGTAELTIGIEDYRKTDIKKLANSPTRLAQALTTDVGKVAVSGIENPSYAGGFIFFRYLARQASDFTIENTTANKTLQTFYGYDQINNSAANVTINTGSGNDTIHNWKDHVKIFGGAGNDVVHNDNYYNTANDVTIDGGKGNDDLTNRGDKVSIVCGAGNDSIYSYGAKTTVSGGSGEDYILNYGKSSSVIGGKGDDIIYNDSLGANVTISAGAGEDFIWNYGSKVTISGGSGSDYIANWGKKVSLNGGSGNDTIFGDAGKDTLRGGKGNDSLWGGKGDDTFIFCAGDGSDKIFDYSSGDMLKILKSNGAAGGKFKKSKFSDGTLTLTISGGGSITFENVTTATDFNINDKSYKISGTKLKRDM